MKVLMLAAVFYLNTKEKLIGGTLKFLNFI
jgi:hypothetical protein